MMDYLFLKTTTQWEIVWSQKANKSTTSKFGLSAYKVNLDRTYSDDSVSSADESAKKLQSKEILTGILSLNNWMKKINSTTRLNKLLGGGLGENANKIESTTPKSFSMKNVNATFKDCRNHINFKWEADGMTKSTPRVASLSRSYFRKVSFSSTANNINKNKKFQFSKYSRKNDFSSSWIEKLQRKYCDYEYRQEDFIDTNNENTTSKSMNKSQSNINNQNKRRCSIAQNKNKLRILEDDWNHDTKIHNINENLHLSKNNIVNMSSPTMSMTKLKGESNIFNHKKRHNQDTFIEEIEIPATANKIKFKMNLEHDKTNPDKQKKSLCKHKISNP